MKRLYVCAFALALTVVAGCSDSGSVDQVGGTSDNTVATTPITTPTGGTLVETDTSSSSDSDAGDVKSPATTATCGNNTVETGEVCDGTATTQSGYTCTNCKWVADTTTPSLAPSGSSGTILAKQAEPIPGLLFSVAPKSYTIKTPSPNTGGSPCPLSCNGGAISGFNMVITSGGWLQFVSLACSDITYATDGSVIFGTPTLSNSACGLSGSAFPQYYQFPAYAVATGLTFDTGTRLDSFIPVLQSISELTGVSVKGEAYTPVGTALKTKRIGGTGGDTTKSVSCPPGSYLTGITFRSAAEIDDIDSVTCVGH